MRENDHTFDMRQATRIGMRSRAERFVGASGAPVISVRTPAPGQTILVVMLRWEHSLTIDLATPAKPRLEGTYLAHAMRGSDRPPSDPIRRCARSHIGQR